MRIQTMFFLFGLCTAILLSGCASPAPPGGNTVQLSTPADTIAPTPALNQVVPTSTPTLVPSDTPAPQPSPSTTQTLPPSPTSTPDVPSEKITLTTEDDLLIAGTLFGEGQGDMAVLLLHMGLGSADQRSWHPFARLLAEAGYTALAIDFRGRGESEGNPANLATNLMIKDARAAVQFLQARGYNRLVCMGASMGGTTCLRLAMETELEGVVVIASTMRVGQDNRVTTADLSQLTIPKLFVCGRNDFTDVVSDMSTMYRAAQQPKQEVIYDNAAHGTSLLLGPYGDDLRQHLLDFLAALG